MDTIISKQKYFEQFPGKWLSKHVKTTMDSGLVWTVEFQTVVPCEWLVRLAIPSDTMNLWQISLTTEWQLSTVSIQGWSPPFWMMSKSIMKV